MATQPSELDFFKIKENLKTFLRSQSEFSDYDFEGSALSTLIDICSYVVHYTGIYANMTFNEMFLDSAKLRSSVVSHAKQLGYMPKQKQAATGLVHVSISNPAGSPSTITIPKGTIFNGTNENGTHKFVTTKSYNLTNDGSGVYSADIEVSEGVMEIFRYAVTSTDQRFVVSTQDLDINHMTVLVKASAIVNDIDGAAFTKANDFTVLTGTDQVYFIEENGDGFVQIYFGDHTIGKGIEVGNEIVVEGLLTTGIPANNAGEFELVTQIDIYSPTDFNVSTANKAFGAADKETIDSIRLIAPKFNEAFGRALTANDFKTILMAKYGWIETIAVWGGEVNPTPEYGKVYIAIKPIGYETITSTTKDLILKYLERYMVVGIIPVIVDPDYIYVNINCTAEYSVKLTTKSTAQLANDISTAIGQFFTNSISNNFETKLTYSNLLHAIDLADASIQNNITTYTLSKRLIPNYLAPAKYTLEFMNELKPNTFIASYTDKFGAAIEIKDDGNGIINVYKNGTLEPSGTIKHTIDYKTGLVHFYNIDFNLVVGTNIEFFAEPVSYNIVASRHNIIIKGTETINPVAIV